MDSKRTYEEQQLGEQKKRTESRTQPSPFDSSKLLLHRFNISNIFTSIHGSCFGGNTAAFHMANLSLGISLPMLGISVAYPKIKALLVTAVSKEINQCKTTLFLNHCAETNPPFLNR